MIKPNLKKLLLGDKGGNVSSLVSSIFLFLLFLLFLQFLIINPDKKFYKVVFASYHNIIPICVNITNSYHILREANNYFRPMTAI